MKKREVLCIDQLPLWIRDMLTRKGAAFPTKGNFYNVVGYTEFQGTKYFELAEFPPSDVGAGVYPHFWDTVIFAEVDDYMGEIEAMLKKPIADPFYAGHETDALNYLLGGYGCRHKWDNL
jgi:hypothetical protein